MTDETPPEDRTAELERRLSEIESSTRARLIQAELKAEAVRAGIVDLDGLKLLDLDKVAVNEAGDVENAALLMRDLRRAKPWLFAGPSTSNPTAPPPSHAPASRRATEMTYAEWQASRAELLKRR